MFVYRYYGGRYDGHSFMATTAWIWVQEPTGHIYVRTADPPEASGSQCILRMRPATAAEADQIEATIARVLRQRAGHPQ